MKVFFTSTTRGQKEFGLYYQQIYKELEALGYDHLDDDVVKTNFTEFLENIEKEDRNGYKEYFNKKNDAIMKADICVFEVSYPTLGLGFVVERALKQGKPTIVLYYKDNIPYTLIGVEDEKLLIKNYTEKTLKKVLRDSLEIAKERRDKRFNFFLSPKLLDYLEGSSKKEGVTKSKLIRDMIVRHMREHVET